MNNCEGIRTIFKFPSWFCEQPDKRSSLPGRKVKSLQLGESVLLTLIQLGGSQDVSLTPQGKSGDIRDTNLAVFKRENWFFPSQECDQLGEHSSCNLE